MIRCDNEQIIVEQFRQQIREARVEPLEICRIPRHVVAMPIEHIEVHQIGEDESGLVHLHRLDRLGDTVGVAVHLDMIGEATLAEDVEQGVFGNDPVMVKVQCDYLKMLEQQFSLVPSQ